MTVEIDESIAVGAVFSHGEIKPAWFTRRGRQVRVREIAFTWKTREGNASILHFSVTDGQGLYEICFNQATLAWRLRSAECEVRNAE